MDPHLLLVLIAAIVVGGICKSRDINSAIPLIVAGFAIDGLIPKTAEELLNPELILTLILAPLVFAAGLASSAVDLRQVRRSVLLLAVVLVVLTTAAVGGVAAALVSLPLAAACAFGAAVAPTDAVAAKAVADRSGLPRRVTLIIEGESLANDGTALTILRVAVAATTAGAITALAAGKILVLAVVGGVLLGALGGFAISWAMRMAKEPVVANAILLLAPFGLYELSEALGGSGLLTLVIAGVWIAHATWAGSGYQARLQAMSVWSLVTFLLESFAFVLVGVEFLDTYNKIIEPNALTIGFYALLLTAVIFIVRVAFMSLWFLAGPRIAPNSFSDRRRTAREFVAIGLLGVRGPVSVLAAFSLPETFPQRDLLLLLTFAIVVLSLCGTFASAPIIRQLNLDTETEEQHLHSARVAVAKAALKRLDEIVEEAGLDGEAVPENVAQRLRSLAVRRLDSLSSTPERASVAVDQVKSSRRLQRAMLQAERDELRRLQVERHTPGDIVRQLTHELDLREAALGQSGRG